MGKEKVEINSALRMWTRGTSFTLAMGKTQVTTLIALHVSASDYIGWCHPMLNHYVTSYRGLQQRGLIVDNPNIKKYKDMTPEEFDNVKFGQRILITEAGKLVIELFKITGIYDEIKKELLSYEIDERPLNTMINYRRYTGRKVG